MIISGLGVGFGDTHPTDETGYWFCLWYIYTLVIITYTFMASVARQDSEVKDVLSQV